MKSIQKLRTFESLGLRDFRLLWSGQLTAAMGMWMDQTARSWLIYSMTGSALQLGMVNAVRGIPLIAFGILAGYAADRWGRKEQLIIAQMINVILNLVLAVLIFTRQIQPWHVYVTGFFSGTVQAFQQPARQVLVNDLVGEKHLLNAISLNAAAFNLSRSVGPAVCGLLINWFGVDVSYFVQAALFALASVWTFQIHVPAVSSGMAKVLHREPMLKSVKEGFSYIAGNRMILIMIILGLGPVMLGLPFSSLLPIFALDILHGDASTQGLLLTMVGIGAVIGALGIASFARTSGSGKLLIIGAIGFGISLVLFSQSTVLWMSMAFTFLAGLTNSAYASQDQTLVQMQIPANLRGRVLGLYFVARGLMPVGSMLAGALAALWGGPLAITIMGGGCALMAIMIGTFTPKLWRLGEAKVELAENG